MGLIKAAIGSVGGVLADQWKEYFYCDTLDQDTLMARGEKRVSRRSSNKRASENIITTGSVIAVADGQCMLIVEQGKVVEVAAEPGEFVFDASTEPSVFAGSFGESLKESFRQVGKRFTFGGEPPKDQRVYYLNTKELLGNKYGTPSPVPFRVVDARAGIDLDISIRCFGEYSYHIADPLLFYTHVCANAGESFLRESLDGQLKTELLTALQPAFARISEMGIRYSALPGHTKELASALNQELSQKWRELRGLEIVSFGISSLKAGEEDERLLQEMQRNVAFMDPTRAAAHLVGAQAAAMQSAGKNEGGGAPMAFMGMNMAGGAGGMNASQLYEMGQQAQPAASGQPSEDASLQDRWTCSCGAECQGKFCPECGAARPKAPSGWTCPQCGTVNQGKFCTECGGRKPAGEPLYRCDKCGWEPADPRHPPKFCPECGDPFDEGDMQ